LRPRRTVIWVTPSLDTVIAAIAGRQHGVITTAQLVQAGLGTSAISKRAANGRLHRRYTGVYAVGQPRLSQQGEWIAATLACGPGAYLASLNAAVHMKLWRRRVTGIHVLMPRGRRTPRGVHAHTYRRLDARDVTRRDGIPATTVPRTLVDLSDVLTPHQLANVIHEAAFRKLFDERAVRAAIHRHWPQLGLIIEVDGPGHTRPRTKCEDEERVARLRAAGHTILRVADEMDLPN
jgi:Transcriptional regulator, AbiEi antitoxin